MKKITVVSGKGGVGKTTLTASLAILFFREKFSLVLTDCDVDAPNLSLILKNQEFERHDIFSANIAIVNKSECISCKKCREHCKFDAISWNDEENMPFINEFACEGCGACKVLCPEHAFEIHPVKSGEIISYKNNMGFPLIYGKTQLGSTTSGKLVSDVKEFLNNSKSFDNSNLILIDGPPGIGCPVIATISNIDYAITISEPTPSGLHDLMRVIEVVQQFNIPFGLIINKSDLKSSFQEDFNKHIRDTGYKILGKIPFDLAIPKAMSFAKPVVDFAPDSKASEEIKKIYKNLIAILKNEGL